MQVKVRASTGVEILVSRDTDVYVAVPAHSQTEPQVCLAADLFEVIAELAGLALDQEEQAQEALALAATAQQRLARGR